jgi:uncharacterized repeat protein (TIGR01451 family)
VSLAVFLAFAGLLTILAVSAVTPTGLPVFQSQVASAQEAVCPSPLSLVNTGFEEPFLPDPASTPPGWQLYANGSPPSGVVAYGIPQGEVPGWSTTDSTGLIQLFRPTGTGFYDDAHSGIQYAETNAVYASKLYQSVDTTNHQGTVLTWSFAHHAISQGGAPETVRLEIGPTGAAPNFTYTSTVVFADGWIVNSGTYTVPAGQTSTEFGWQSVVSPAPNAGNLLDSIQFGIEECAPALTLEKTSDVGPTEPLVEGDVITYSFEVENTGNVDLENVTVTDELEGLSAVTPAVVASLPVGEIATFTATYTVTLDDVNAGTIENTATTTADIPEGCDGCDPPTATDTLITPPDQTTGLSLVKTSDVGVDDVPTVGDVITYTFTVENTGNVTLTNVTVADPLVGLSAITPPSVATLNPDETAPFTATYTVTQADVDRGYILNEATATGIPPTGCTDCEVPISPPGELIVPIPPTYGLGITKEADTEGPVAAGDVITYTFTVENTGTVTVPTATIVDALPNLVWVTGPDVGPIAPGASVTGEATYTVTADDVAAGGVTNSATVTCEEPCVIDPVPPSEITIPGADPGLTIVKEADPIGGIVADDTITYTFTVENTGNTTLEDVTITDTLAGLTWVTGPNVGTLAPGDIVTGEATYVVTQDDVDNGGVTNVASADCAVSCITDPPIDEITVTPNQTPGLSFDKTADTAGPVGEGDVITYSFLVENTGTVTLDDVTITDALAGLSWVTGPNVGTLAPGDVVTGEATYTVTAEDVAAGGVTNAASVDCAVSCIVDPPTDGITLVGDEPGMVFRKTADTTGPVNEGDVITYTFTAENTGNTTFENVTVTDVLAGLEWVSGPTLGAIAPGATATGTATYTVTLDDVLAGGVSNAASVTCDAGCEEVPPAEVFVPGGELPPAGILTVEKTSDVSGEVHPGDVITYTFVVTNTGGTAVDNVVVTDPLPGLSAIEGPQGTTLAPGESATFTATYPVTELDADTGSIVNTAIVSGTDATGTTVEDQDSVSLEACTIGGAPEVIPTPGPGTPEADLDADAEPVFEGAATCDGDVQPQPTPTEPADPEPTRAPGGNNGGGNNGGGGGGGMAVTDLPSTGQTGGNDTALTIIFPLGAMTLLGLAVGLTLIQRRKQDAK